jgi:hypothetical protein
VRQRGSDPAFYPVGPAYVPVDSNGMLFAAIAGIVAETGDVYKFQWLSDCSEVALEPTAIDVGLLGVANGGFLPVSAYLIAARV